MLIRLEELKNSQQPIQRLPPDIITVIATFLDPRACGGDCQSLVAMSQVCRYWRETLLFNPESWSFIGSEYTELLPLFLERSKSHPLEINLTSETILPHIIQHIEAHADRIGILRYNLKEADIVTLQTLFRLDNLPGLRTFSIKISRPPTVAPEVEEMVLFSGKMPALRMLELLPFPIIPQFAESRNLVDLRLDVVYSTLTAVLDLLAANPLLERVRLLGNFDDDEDTREARSVFMRRLRFLAVERCTPCLFLEKLTFPPNARIFIRYIFIHHLNPFGYTLPQFIRGYTNLQELSSLHLLIADPSDTYIDVTGPNGSVAIQYTDLRDHTILSNVMTALPAMGVTELTCEFHPAFTGMEMGSVVLEVMDVLHHLEEITLVRFGGIDMHNFFTTLEHTDGWRNLRRLKFIHCQRVRDWIGDLIGAVLEREASGSTLDTATIVLDGSEQSDLFGVLETVEIVEEEPRQMVKSVQVWDDVNCTLMRTSVPVWAD